MTVRSYLRGVMLVAGVLLTAAWTAAGPFEDAIRNGNNAYFDGDFATAESYYTTAIGIDGSSAVAYNNRGLARYRQESYVAAEIDFAAAKSRDATYIAPYLNLGKCKAAQGSWSAAIAELDAGLVIEPTHPSLLYNRGWIYDEIDQYTNALNDFDAALTADPNHLKALAAKAVTLAKDGQDLLAVDTFYQVINSAEPGSMLAATAAYNLQLLRGPGVDFDSDTAAQDFQDGIFAYTVGLYDLAAGELASARAAESDVPDIPWLQALTEIKRHDNTAANAFLATAYSMMTSIDVLGSYLSTVYLDGIPRGETPTTLPVFASRFDLTLRHLDAFNDRERSVPLYTDGTPGGATTVAMTPGITAAFTDFAEVTDSDTDWLGDGWESTELGDLSQGPADDPDTDTVSNLLEYWHGSDPDLADSDSDGIDDVDEIAGGTDPAAQDSDGDLVPDGWEVGEGLDPRGDTDLELDPDGDGLPHFGEWLLGSDPGDPADPPTVYVDGGSGSDTTGDGSSGNPWATVQYAINQAVAPAIVKIAAGTYPENLTLAGGIALVGSGDRGDTSLDAGGAGRVVSVATAASGVALVNLELTGGAVSGYGGGLFADTTDVYLAGLRIRDNHTLSAYQYGGGVHVRNANLRLVGSELIGNYTPGSAAYGGALFFRYGSARVMSTTVSGSTGSGGAAIFAELCGFRLASSTVGNNGYRAVNLTDCSSEIINSVIWNNTWDLDRSTGHMSIAHSLIGNVEWSFNSDGNVRLLDNALLGYDPLFVDHDQGDLRLRPDSPCIDAAAGDEAPAADVYGQSRWDHPGVADSGSGTPSYVDMGSHELHDSDLDGMTDLWETELFGGLGQAAGGDFDNDELSNKDEFDRRTDPTDDDSDDDGLPDGWEVANSLDPLDDSGDNGAGGDPDADLLVNGDELSYGTDPQHEDSERDGFPDGWEVSNGFAPLVWDADEDDDRDGLSNFSEYVLGTAPGSAASPPAVYVNGTHGSDTTGTGSAVNPWATVQHAIDSVTPPVRIRIAAGTYPERITVVDGIALVGAGMDSTVLDGEQAGRTVTAASGADVVLQDLAVINGSIDAAGGGFSASGGGKVAFDGVRFEDNQTTGTVHAGGGAFVYNCEYLRITGCVFRDNRTLHGTSHGGGLYASGTDSGLVNTLFAGNNAEVGGRADGAFLGGTPTVISCTFVDHPQVPLDFIYAEGEIINSVIWHNGSPITNDNSTITVRYSNLEETTYDGPGVIHVQPTFLDRPGGDYRLDAGSAGVDAGESTYAPPEDFFGTSRNSLPWVPNTGGGTRPYVEMGFHEVTIPLFSDGFESGSTAAWPRTVQ